MGIELGMRAAGTPAGNVATKRWVGSKNDRRAGTHFFEPGGYKIEPLLTKIVNDDI